jgi:predicted deacylase
MPTSCDLHHVTATLTNGATTRVPYWRVNSGRPGERFLITAAQHGIELNGCEVIRRFRDVCLTDLRRGEVVLFPFTNLPAVRSRRSNLTALPEQPHGDTLDHNMNYHWPGDPEGNDTRRLTHALYEAVVNDCTCCFDIHSWSRFTASACLVREGLPAVQRLAEVVPLRFREFIAAPAEPRGMIDSIFCVRGQGAITVELAPQWVIREDPVRQGLQAAINMARVMGMMAGEPELLEGPIVEFHQDTWRERAHTLTAPCSGLFVENGLQAGDPVEAGQSLGHLIADADLQTVEITAPLAGYLWNYGCHRAHSDVALPPQHPYADAGDTLAAIMQP